MKEGQEDQKETGRVEAFSDGVFAIAITLLILEVKVPTPTDASVTGGLSEVLRRQWPMYVAYLASFATILVMWVNHHKMFTHIRRVDDPFLFLNGLLLLFVSFVPFPTALVSEHLRFASARAAALIYAGTYEALAIAFNLLWGYAATHHRLLGSHVKAGLVQALTRQYRTGPALYLIALGLAFFSADAGFGYCLLLAVYWACVGSLTRFFGEANAGIS